MARNYPIIYNFETVSNDYWEGEQFVIDLNNEAMDLTNVGIEVYFKQRKSNEIVKQLTINNGVVVDDVAGGILSIGGIVLDIPFGRYDWGIVFTIMNQKKTYIKGIAVLTKNVD